MKIRPTRNPQAFALIVTITLMVLLSVISLGLLSLSSIALRSVSRDQAQAEARANARLAIQLAIGELQIHTGVDTRITAPANIIEPVAPPIVGAWRSWEGMNHETAGATAGRPIRPNYGVKRVVHSEGNQDGRFLQWLVSTATRGQNLNNPSVLVSGSAAGDGSMIALLSTGTLGANPGQIHVVPQPMENDEGAFAWWVSAENQKARLAQPHAPRNGTVAALAEMGQTHSVANPTMFGLAGLMDDPEAHNPSADPAKPGRRALSRQTMSLIGADDAIAPHRRFHDLSPYAGGLLTNTATGGWRKDMSILTERWDQIYAGYQGGRLPMFRYSPAAGSTSLVPRPVMPAATVAVTNTATLTAATPAMANLYPWSNYSLILGFTQPGTYHAASASWASLQSFATSYRNFSNVNGVVTSPFVWSPIAKQSANNVRVLEVYNHKHVQRLHPQIARFQFIVYARAIEDPARLNQNPRRYQMQLLYVPFFTLWNPYNVTLEHTISGTLNASQGSGQHMNFLGFGWRRSVPGAMAIVNQATFPNPMLVPNTQYRLLTNGNFQALDSPSNNVNPYDNQLPGNQQKFGTTSVWRDARTWGCWLPEGTLTFKPGEAKIFAVDELDTGYGFGGTAFRLKEGYNPTQMTGLQFNHTANLLATQSFWFLFRNDRDTQPYLNRAPGYGFSLSFGDGGTHFGGTAAVPSGIGDEFHNITSLASAGQGDLYWPPVQIDEIGYSVAELASGPWIPLYSVSFGPRMTIGTAPGTVQNRPTRGFLQSNALPGMVLSDPASGAGKDHPANNTFDFAYHSLSMGSTITPNVSDSKAFIATGHQSGDGLSRLVMMEIPLRPMASLVELLGWNPRGHNPYPPFQMNLIGNSDATPLIPQDDVVPPTLSPSNPQTNLMHDDAYCANHLLFDDWFVSSIAPDPASFGNTISRDIQTVYRDFLRGESRLANRAYLPIAADTDLTDAGTSERIEQVINSADGWLKVASRLDVEGMFNVNSTSVEAWKALLGHAKSRDQIAMHGQNGIVAEDVSRQHVVTRGAIATDIEAGTGAGFGAQFGNASEYTGFRSLTDAQIEDLAVKIVEQVRLRGPFLSLAEFVNRQLSSDNGLALAGAVQTAINNLADDPMAELRDPGNSLSSPTMLPSDPKMAGVGYEFPEAAMGDSAFGVPGWIRQADILRPLAPVLSARDDTFTIRAYGDSRDGSGDVVARAWCEVVVRRSREFVHSADAADSINPPTRLENVIHGRRYEIVSFRWLNPDEV